MERELFVPFRKLSKSRQREVAILLQKALDKLLTKYKRFKPTMVDSIKLKSSKVKKKREVGAPVKPISDHIF